MPVQNFLMWVLMLKKKNAHNKTKDYESGEYILAIYIYIICINIFNRKILLIIS